LSEIGLPLSLWHGDADTLIPFHHSKFGAEQVRAAVLYSCAGEGHLAMFGHQLDVLAELLERGDELSRRVRR
jgi:pimeloyl-ACP methyl ester carboxylesterase